MEATIQPKTFQPVQFNEAEVRKALVRYAADSGVAFEHILVGSLGFAAEQIQRASGRGVIPVLAAMK